MIFKPFGKQVEVLEDTISKIILIVCGKRSGKTTVGAVKFIKTITDNIANNIHDDYLIVGPTYRVLSNATLPTLAKYWPRKLGIFKKSDSCIDLCDGKKIFIISAENEDRLEGFKARACWCDEAGQISRTAFERIWQRLTPLAGEEQGQLIITTSPYGTPSAWLNKDLIEHRKDLNYVHYFNWTTKDNTFISSEAIDTAQKLIDPRIFKRDYEGQYTNIAGLIFPDFDRTIDVINSFDAREMPKFIGFDYGFSDPTAITVFTKDFTTGNFYLIDSYYKSKGTVEEYANFLKKYSNIREVCYDPSAVGIMQEVQKLCNGIYFKPADNTVTAGIARLTPLFKQHKIQIFRGNEDVINDLESYIYAEGKDKPKHDNSHGPDSIRYCFQGSILGYKPRKGEVTERTPEELNDIIQQKRKKLNFLDEHWTAPKQKTASDYIPVNWEWSDE